MKTSLRLLACVLLLQCVGMARAEAPTVRERVLDSFHQAAARADLDTYLALLTEDMVFLGTDGSERWEGEAFREFVRANFDEGRGWRYVPQTRNITLGEDARTAWFDETLHNETLGQCRGSGVMVNTAGGWKIAQYNLSLPLPNQLVLQLVEDIENLEGGAVAGTTGQSGDADFATAVPEEAASEPAAARNCKRKRHKTNRRAGC